MTLLLEMTIELLSHRIECDSQQVPAMREVSGPYAAQVPHTQTSPLPAFTGHEPWTNPRARLASTSGGLVVRA
jgi:hypothetical protein